MRPTTTIDMEKDIVRWLRNETGLGLMTLTRCFREFVEALKRRPHPKMDVGLRMKIEWEEYDQRNPSNE